MVLGMHRSGTSLVSRGLKVFGFEHGERLMRNSDNAKGHWEDLDLVACNDALLAAIGKQWYALTPLSPDEHRTLLHSPHKAAAQELITAKLALQPSLAFKDPRSSLLLPFWHAVVQELGLQPTLVLAVRKPIEVANSLLQRDGYPLQRGLLLWLHYNIAVLQAVHKLELTCWVVDYNQLLQQPQQELKQLGTHMRTTADNEELLQFCDTFLDASLNHHAQADSIDQQNTIGTLTNKLYALLQRHHENGQVTCSAQSNADLQTITKAWQELTPLLQLCDLEFATIGTARQDELQARAELAAVRAEIDKLYASTSWQLTQPLRSIKDWLKQQGHHQA
mgnify:FL=1